MESTGGSLDQRSVSRALLVAALAVGAGWFVLLAAWGDAIFALTFDDAYYYFSIARNMADGQGSTFDGINATNGYHPLWLLASVPVFMVGPGDELAVRILLGLQILVYTGALAVMGLSVARAVGGWPRIAAGTSARRLATAVLVAAFLLFAANPFVTRMFVNGLESGLSVLIYALLLARIGGIGAPRISQADDRHRAGTALLLLAAVLTRTDAVLLVGCIALWAAAELRPLLRSDPVRAVGNLATLVGPAALGLGAYLAINQVSFGTAVQVSGLVKRADLDPTRTVTLVVLLTVAAAVGVATWRRAHSGESRSGRFARTASFVDRTGTFAAFGILIIAYYNTLQVQQWLWYYAPIGLYLGWLLLLAVADFVESAAAEATTTRRTATAAIAPVAAILLLPFLVAMGLQLHSFADPHLRSIQMANRDAAVWMDENLPDDAVLASWDAGVLGYFSNRPVVNLDGVANSHEYYRAMQAGTVAEHLDDNGVGWIANHSDADEPTILPSIERIWDAPTAEATELANTWEFRYAGHTVGGEGRRGGDRNMAVFLYELPSR